MESPGVDASPELFDHLPGDLFRIEIVFAPFNRIPQTMHLFHTDVSRHLQHLPFGPAFSKASLQSLDPGLTYQGDLGGTGLSSDVDGLLPPSNSCKPGVAW